MTLSVGDTFAGYRIVAVLHVTPSDAVYLVAHPTAPADEILRVHSPSVEVDVYTDDRIYGEFRQEMSAAEYLLVDGLAAIHRVGRTDGRTWMTSAAAQGKPSRTVLAERGPLPIADVVRIAQTVAVTLDTLHRNSVIHRDIGTHCIYLDHRSNPPRTTLAGLDNPRRMPTPTPDVTAPEPPLIVHNPSPEHLADKVLTPAADQFSLACTVFELLTGTGPFSRAGSIPGMIVATLQEQPGPLGHRRPDLSDQVERIIHRALNKDPRRRFPSCSEFASALTTAALPRPVHAPNLPRAYRLCAPHHLPNGASFPTGAATMTWYVRRGEAVALGDPLFAATAVGSEAPGVLEYSTVIVYSPVAGTVVDLRVDTDCIVEPGEAVAVIGEPVTPAMYGSLPLRVPCGQFVGSH